MPGCCAWAEKDIINEYQYAANQKSCLIAAPVVLLNSSGPAHQAELKPKHEKSFVQYDSEDEETKPVKKRWYDQVQDLMKKVSGSEHFESADVKISRWNKFIQPFQTTCHPVEFSTRRIVKNYKLQKHGVKSAKTAPPKPKAGSISRRGRESSNVGSEPKSILHWDDGVRSRRSTRERVSFE